MNQQFSRASRLDVMAKDRARLLAMMALFFLVVCAVGILRPIKNSLALDGLGATAFYKVYLVSAVVIFFPPLFNRAADRVPWRWLLPGVALFFALNLVVFRLIYVEGSIWFGLAFYGWYDLFAAALVTQFFMATQLFFDARSAKKAYPLVIAGGSIGATLGGAITGFFAESVGTPNLLLVAAALIVIFSLAMPWVWGPSSMAGEADRTPKLEMGELAAIFSNRHVRLIAASVLMTVLVKQLVDFQFNALSKEVFETRDAISAFQGKFNAATQWLPMAVLIALRPALQRWGVGAAVLWLPAAMLATTTGLAITFGIWAAVAAKATETSLRYSAERAGREILYIPVPDDIKLKAKAYIDVAIEKGLGKVLSAGLIALLMVFLNLRGIAVFTVAVTGLWLTLAIAVRREYVRALARSIEGRFASVRGLFIALMDATSVPALRSALDSNAPLRAAFALELLAEVPSRDIRELAPELNDLARAGPAEIRMAALDQLARVPELADEAVLRTGLHHGDPAVREASVRALAARGGAAAGEVLAELLSSEEPAIRTAALTHLVERGSQVREKVLDRSYLEGRWASARSGDTDARTELALASAALDDREAARFLDPFLDDADPRVLSTALRSAGLLGRVDCADRMIAALGAARTRPAARDALVALGTAAIPPLSRALLDDHCHERVRRAVPGVLARIPHQETVEALIALVLAPETDQLLDFRGLKALGKLRKRDPDLHFDPGLVLEMADREAVAARRYARTVVPRGGGRAAELLASGLLLAWHERRESVFRCLGLLYPSHEVYRAWAATTSGTGARRANALEWLEQAAGHEVYRRFADVIELTAPPKGRDTAAISCIERDADSWLAMLARAHGADPPLTDGTMELIEKVFLLQGVDLLSGVPGAHLALLASIAEEIEVPTDTVLIAEGEPTSAMYIVTRGCVALNGVGHHVSLDAEQAFGTWALIDESPSPLEARATEETRLLRITRLDLHDLLADHSELAVTLLRGLARRMRSIVA